MRYLVRTSQNPDMERFSRELWLQPSADPACDGAINTTKPASSILWPWTHILKCQFNLLRTVLNCQQFTIRGLFPAVAEVLTEWSPSLTGIVGWLRPENTWGWSAGNSQLLHSSISFPISVSMTSYLFWGRRCPSNLAWWLCVALGYVSNLCHLHGKKNSTFEAVALWCLFRKFLVWRGSLQTPPQDIARA